MKKAFILTPLILLSIISFGQNQLELNEISYKNFQTSDKKLNKVYNNLIKLMSSTKEKSLLINAQKAWVTFRINTAKYEESKYQGGSAMQMIFFDTQTRLTKIRIIELEEDIKERENH